MINQPDAVYSFTIPYYTTKNGETDELFVSKTTYEKYVNATNHDNIIIIHGSLHPISPQYGEATCSLYNQSKIIIIVGTKDLDEFTNELLDIAIATELEKSMTINKSEYFRYLYLHKTPDYLQLFIDDIQQTLEEIHILKRLSKEGYRISEREKLIWKDMNTHFGLGTLRELNIETEYFLLAKLLLVANIDEAIYKQYKNSLQKSNPKLVVLTEQLRKSIQKYNLSTAKGRQKALKIIFQQLGCLKYVKVNTINDFQTFTVPINLDFTVS